MLGLGYYFGFGAIFTNRTGRSFLPELQAGVIFPEVLSCYVRSTRCTHFAGGAGIIIPDFKDMKDYDFRQLKEWDDKTVRSYILDPASDLKFFEKKSEGLEESDFKDGIRLNLIATKFFIEFFKNKVIELRGTRIVTVINRKNGNPISEHKLEKEMKNLSVLLDQYMLSKGLITGNDIETLKNWLETCLPKEMVNYVEANLKVNPYLTFNSKLIELEELDPLVDEMVEFANSYLEECYDNWVAKKS